MPTTVAVSLPGEQLHEFPTATAAVRWLLREHCTPAECQALKVDGLRTVQQGFPVETHQPCRTGTPRHPGSAPGRGTPTEGRTMPATTLTASPPTVEELAARWGEYLAQLRGTLADVYLEVARRHDLLSRKFAAHARRYRRGDARGANWRALADQYRHSAKGYMGKYLDAMGDRR